MSQEEIERLVTAVRNVGETDSRVGDRDSMYAAVDRQDLEVILEAVTGMIEREQGRME